MSLQLLLFGHYQLRTEAGPAKFATDHARALLAYLAIEARPHQRTSLATLLWPEQPEPTARQNLRQALVYLKKAIQPLAPLLQPLEVTSKTVYLQPTALTTDVVNFRQLVATCAAHTHSALLTCPDCLRRLQTAADFYVGEFLQGFFIRNSPPFEEWALYTREQLHHQAIELLNTLTHHYETIADYQAMQQLAARQLLLEPWREAAHVQRMRALALSGQSTAALAHYATCVRVLDEELGVAPAAATTALYETIRAGQLRSPQSTAGTENILVVKHQPSVAKAQPAADLATATGERDWATMPAVEHFHGRQTEMAQLQQWLLADQYRVVAILGMGGLGKTTLAARLTQKVAAQFDTVIWRSLLNAPPLGEILAGWLRTLSGQRLITLPQQLDEQLQLLVTYLRATRALLVLDNLESIMQSGAAAGTVRDGYEAYTQLWQLLATTAHQSCLLLTSREEPQGLTTLASQPQTIARLNLSGLDPGAGAKLLLGHGVNTTPVMAQSLINHYSGNPLALQLVATTILDLFDGDIAAFQQDGAPIFDDIRTVLDGQFMRLSALEQELLIWLAIEREPITLPQLAENLAQRPPRHAFVEALRALQRRSLVEQNNATFTMQNVVIEYLTDRLHAMMVADLVDQLSGARPVSDPITPGEPTPLEASPFNRYALMKADAKESVRKSQIRLILQPVALALSERLGRVSLQSATKRLLTRLRTTIPLRPGYAAGNLLNLLQELGLELQGLNFANLTVWQADLRAARLHQCDFSGADLTRSLFTDNFGLINTVAISPDGTLLAAGTGNGQIRLWQRHDRRPAGAIQAHSSHIWALAFSPDGRWLASSGDDQLIRLWDLQTITTTQTHLVLSGHTGGVHTIGFSPDSRLLASGGTDQQIRLWAVTNGQQQRRLEGHTGCVYTLAFSPTGHSLVSGSDDQTIRVWTLRGATVNTPMVPGCRILQGHSERVYSVAFSPDGALIASGSADYTICLWRWQEREQRGELHGRLVGHSHIVRAVAFSPDGQMVASASYDETIRLWSVASGQTRQTLYGHRAWIRTLAFSPDGQQLVSGSFDYTLRLWDLQPDQEQTHYLLRGYTNLVRAVAFSPDGQTIAGGSDDHLVRLWTLRHATDGSVSPVVDGILAGHTRTLRALAFSPNGRWLASGGYDYTVCVWDLARRGRAAAPLCYKLRHDNFVRAVAFSPDSQRLATSSSDHSVRLWDSASGALRHHLRGHTDSVWGVAFSPDGELLASCSADCTVKIWRPADGHLLQSFQAHTQPVKALAFSPRGDHLATGSEDHSVRVWAVATGELCYTCHGHSDFIWSVAFSPDGQSLASSSSDRTIRRWDLRDHSPTANYPPPVRHLLTGHRDWVWMIAFSPDGQTLVSCSDDETVKIWAVAGGDCRQTLRAPGPYAGMQINGVSGLSPAQKAALKALGAVEAPAPLRQHTPPPLALPVHLTPFVGRADALAALNPLLRAGESRLLTLTGAGGMGKTRLALEMGSINHAYFDDGVYFVALAALTQAAELAPAIAVTLGLPQEQRKSHEQLYEYLHPKRLLLILDNFEQLLPTAQAQTTSIANPAALDLVCALLQQAPQLQMLITSHEPLNLHGERRYSVEGLPLPTQIADQAADQAGAITGTAVDFFAQSARRVRSDFRVTPANLPILYEICQLVQGMPLGLEMAAAWVDQLTLAEIAAEMHNSLDFLTLTGHDLPARQRSLRALFTWSWELLTPTEQTRLCRLAIFRGGFTRHAAEKVAGAKLRELTTLVHKSLLWYQPDDNEASSARSAGPTNHAAANDGWPNAGGRYRLHELLRQFAYEQLLTRRTNAAQHTPVNGAHQAHTPVNGAHQAHTEQQDDYTVVAGRHRDYYLAFLAEHGGYLTPADVPTAPAALQAELENLRQAWATPNGDDRLPADV